MKVKNPKYNWTVQYSLNWMLQCWLVDSGIQCWYPDFVKMRRYLCQNANCHHAPAVNLFPRQSTMPLKFIDFSLSAGFVRLNDDQHSNAIVKTGNFAGRLSKYHSVFSAVCCTNTFSAFFGGAVAVAYCCLWMGFKRKTDYSAFYRCLRILFFCYFRCSLHTYIYLTEPQKKHK